jgi:hypothetical protein
MITSSDSFTTYDLGKYYVILPQVTNFKLEDYIKHFNAKLVPQGFHYTSENNTEWETVEGLRKLIIEHVDPDFKP